MRPIVARISPAALAHNLNVARRRAPSAQMMAVIKAAGYGHGLLRAAQAMSAADAFAVCELDAAVRLREAGFRQRIVLLEGFFSAAELPVFCAHRFTPVLHQQEQIDLLAATPLPLRLDALVKVNTGMNRLGGAPARAHDALAALEAIPWVGALTLMTHFACADEPGGIETQLARFGEVCARTPDLPRSLANSAALLADARTHAAWVRPGIMLYGASPFAHRSAQELGLAPAMTLASEIIAVQTLEPGAAVGYGATFRAETAMRIGIVACGYADGYPRHAPNGTPVLVDGMRVPLAGRVSMDMLAVDLTHAPAAQVGSPVVLWGEGLPADEVARHAGTIAYQLFCAVAPRVAVETID